MNWFDRVTLSPLAAGTLTLIVAAVLVPVNRLTRAPDAEFLPPDAVPKVVSAEELRQERLRDKQPQYTTEALLQAFQILATIFTRCAGRESALCRAFSLQTFRGYARDQGCEKKKDLFSKVCCPWCCMLMNKLRRIALG